MQRSIRLNRWGFSTSGEELGACWVQVAHARTDPCIPYILAQMKTVGVFYKLIISGLISVCSLEPLLCFSCHICHLYHDHNCHQNQSFSTFTTMFPFVVISHSSLCLHFHSAADYGSKNICFVFSTLICSAVFTHHRRRLVFTAK